MNNQFNPKNNKLKFLNESKVPEYQLTDQLKIKNKNQEQTAIN